MGDEAGAKTPIWEKCYCSERHHFELSVFATLEPIDGLEMPKPLRIGRAVRWGRSEIKAWMDHGCPPASEWT